MQNIMVDVTALNNVVSARRLNSSAVVATRQITKSFRFADKAIDYTTLARARVAPPSRRSVHQPRHGPCATQLVQLGGREAVVFKDTHPCITTKSRCS